MWPVPVYIHVPSASNFTYEGLAAAISTVYVGTANASVGIETTSVFLIIMSEKKLVSI